MTTEFVLKYLKELQNKSNNKCGTTVINLSILLNISQNEIKTHLKELYNNKQISVRKGLNNQLIFLRNYDTNNK